jgi:hypothetical protein
MWVFFGGCIAYSILVSYLHLDAFGEYPGTAAVTAVTGILMMAATLRKTEYAIFVSDSGTSLLGIGHSTKDPDSFQMFITLLVEQIRKCRPAT